MRALPMDKIPGPVGLIVMPLTAADTFSTEQIADAIISPDVVIDEDLFTQEGNLNIEEVLAWDVTRLQLIQQTSPLNVASEDKNQTWNCGLLRDNSVTAVPPTSDADAQHTRPGANQLGPDSRYVERWAARLSSEENAAGEITSENTDWLSPPDKVYSRLAHKTNEDVSEVVLSDAHYHFWGISSAMTAAVAQWNMGMRARRISMDFLELMFDRQTLLGILNAVGQVF